MVLVLFVSACSSDTSTEQNTSEYTDIASFVKQEVDFLKNRGVVLVKRSSWQGETQTDTLKQVNWEEEMYPFLELDIKPTVWVTDFTLSDSSRNNGEIIREFKARNDLQELRSFSIITLAETGEIRRIDAEVKVANKLTTSIQKISYTKGIGYTIAGKRDTKALGSEDYQIVGQFYIQKD